MIDWKSFVEENDIPNWPYGGIRRSKQCRSGWIQLEVCPFCNGHMHMGIHEQLGICSCYFCSTHSPTETVKALLDSSWGKAYDQINKHKISAIDELEIVKESTKRKSRKRNKTLELPPHTKLKKSGAEYLISRGFSPKTMVEQYGVVQGKKGSDFKDRVIFPVFFNGELVSYGGRDITNKQINKYKFCSTDKEVLNTKEILYLYDQCNEDFVIVVEGVLDACKFPLGIAVATFGIKYSQQQINLLREKYKTVYVLYDGEIKARAQSKSLASGLSIHGVESYSLELKEGVDPGDLSYEECEEIVESLKNS